MNRGPLPPGVVARDTAIPWSLPPGFREFVAPYPREDRAAYLAAGLDGGLEDWRGVLGWSGPGSLMAAMELRDAVLRGRGVTVVEFPEWEI